MGWSFLSVLSVPANLLLNSCTRFPSANITLPALDCRTFLSKTFFLLSACFMAPVYASSHCCCVYFMCCSTASGGNTDALSSNGVFAVLTTIPSMISLGASFLKGRMCQFKMLIALSKCLGHVCGKFSHSIASQLSSPTSGAHRRPNT